MRPRNDDSRTEGVGIRQSRELIKCLNRAEFVIVGWSDPEGARHLVGALLLGYYEPDGRLIYAGRVGTGMSVRTLATLHRRLEPLSVPRCRCLFRHRAEVASAARWRC